MNRISVVVNEANVLTDLDVITTCDMCGMFMRIEDVFESRPANILMWEHDLHCHLIDICSHCKGGK